MREMFHQFESGEDVVNVYAEYLGWRLAGVDCQDDGDKSANDVCIAVELE